MYLGLVCAWHYDVALLVHLLINAHFAFEHGSIDRQEIGLLHDDVLTVSELRLSLFE